VSIAHIIKRYTNVLFTLLHLIQECDPAERTWDKFTTIKMHGFIFSAFLHLAAHSFRQPTAVIILRPSTGAMSVSLSPSARISQKPHGPT